MQMFSVLQQAVNISGVPMGGFGGLIPPEIPKFWQSRVEFPVPWKIDPY
jgi:hypothetical protein